MFSIVTVISPSATQDLTVLDRVKRDLGIDNNDSDDRLTELIHEESASFTDLVCRILASETVIEEFRTQWGGHRQLISPRQNVSVLRLTRYPVTEITSVTEGDDPVLDPSLYEVDAEPGLLYRLDADGNTHQWMRRTTVVVYTGGYTLLDTLPRKIETAVLSMIRSRWFSIGRDPTVRSRNIVDVGTVTYWSGPTGAGAGSDVLFPPEVQSAIDTYRAIPT